MASKKLLLIGSFLILSLVFSGTSFARVSVSVVLPPLVFAAPPPVVVIPETYVYYCPDVAVDVFFYHGYWYRPFEGRWYRASGYNGPWAYIAPRYVPDAVFHVPGDFRAREYHRIQYGELHRNWRAWERDRYWERHDWGRRDFERERHHGIAPSYRDRERHER